MLQDDDWKQIRLEYHKKRIISFGNIAQDVLVNVIEN